MQAIGYVLALGDFILQTLLYDLSFALRQLRKTPGLAVLAIVTLALGVGANTAIFTVVESVLLRPLPYPHSDRLVFVAAGGKAEFTNTSWLNYRDIRDQSQLMSDAAAYSEDVGVIEGGRRQSVSFGAAGYGQCAVDA